MLFKQLKNFILSDRDIKKIFKARKGMVLKQSEILKGKFTLITFSEERSEKN